MLVFAFVCCFCSNAARRRSPLGPAAFQESFSMPNEEEIADPGLQTPDAVPAYSTTSPSGPLSPEMVDAISRTSIEFRQSLAISILSSSNSLQHRQGSASMEIQVGTAQSSMVSSIDDFVPLHSLSDSPRSSMNSERPFEDSDEADIYRFDTSPRSSQDSRSGSTHPAGQAPPTYDPTWRTVLYTPRAPPSTRPLSYSITAKSQRSAVAALASRAGDESNSRTESRTRTRTYERKQTRVIAGTRAGAATRQEPALARVRIASAHGIIPHSDGSTFFPKQQFGSPSRPDLGSSVVYFPAVPLLDRGVDQCALQDIFSDILRFPP